LITMQVVTVQTATYIQNSIPGQHKLCEFNDPSAIRRNGIEYYKAHVHHWQGARVWQYLRYWYTTSLPRNNLKQTKNVQKCITPRFRHWAHKHTTNSSTIDLKCRQNFELKVNIVNIVITTFWLWLFRILSFSHISIVNSTISIYPTATCSSGIKIYMTMSPIYQNLHKITIMINVNYSNIIINVHIIK